MTNNKRNYSNIYDIKNFIRQDFMPKYFPIEDVNDLNVGLLGFNTDVISTITEDNYNTVTSLIREMLPNTAVLPESLYTYAALFRMSELMATPATLSIVLLVSEEAILSFGKKEASFIEMMIDRNTLIDIEGLTYMPDYDIRIQAKPARTGGYTFTTSYDYSFTNSLNPSTTSPYIKNVRYVTDQGTYIGIMCDVHQVEKTSFEEVILNNAVINYPKFEFEYEDELGNIEIFYKEPTSSEYIQLKKVLKNSPPVLEPFCYYTLKDNKTVEISFSSKTRYFQPKFNSDIIVEIYSTKGDKGNFPVYKGSNNNISVLTNGEKFDYNTKLILYAIPQSDSKGGSPQPDFETLQRIVAEKFSTISTITTETDLEISFANTKYKTGVDVLFLKKRDDALERLFSSFSLYKDKNSEIYHANTLDLELTKDEFDKNEVGRLIIQPGKIFKYKYPTGYIADTVKGATMHDNLDNYGENFLFTNLLMIYIYKEPNIIGYYLNSINEKIVTNYEYLNTDTTNQFISNNINISRNALIGESSYKIDINLASTNELTVPVIDENGNWLNNIKVKAFLRKSDGTYAGHIPFRYTSYDKESNLFSFEAYMETDDDITLHETIRCKMKNMNDSQDMWELIPYKDLIVEVAVFVREPDPLNHQFVNIEDLTLYSLTNLYSTRDNRATLIYPFQFIRSSIHYEKEYESDEVKYKILSSPLMSAYDAKVNSKYVDMLENLNKQFEYINTALKHIKNNYNIDLKFIGTYGRSKIFETEEGTLLDSLNCSVTLDIKFLEGTDTDISIPRIKDVIIDFFEGININGDNSIKASNLIQKLENEFDEIDYLKFVSFNNYPSSIQVLINTVPDPVLLDNDKMMSFVPEYVTLRPDDVNIRVL